MTQEIRGPFVLRRPIAAGTRQSLGLRYGKRFVGAEMVMDDLLFAIEDLYDPDNHHVGLNADLLDGYHASEFGVLSEDETVTGDWTFGGNTTFNGPTVHNSTTNFNDQVFFNDDVNTDITPCVTSLYDIGAVAQVWAEGHFDDFYVYDEAFGSGVGIFGHWQRTGTVLSPTVSDDTLQVGAGSAAAPSLAFPGPNNDVGWYLPANDAVACAINGVQTFMISAANIQSTQIFLGPNGAVTAPTYSFSNDSDTGAYLLDTAQYAIAAGGETIGVFLNSGGNKALLLEDGSATLPGYGFLNDTNIGMYRIGADRLGFATDSSLALEIDATQNTLVKKDLTVSGDVSLGDGSSRRINLGGGALDDITFSGQVNSDITFDSGANRRINITDGFTARSLTIISGASTGLNANGADLFLDATNKIGSGTDGRLKLATSSGQLTVGRSGIDALFEVDQVLAQFGTAAKPGYSWEGKTDDGIMQLSAIVGLPDGVGLVSGGRLGFGVIDNDDSRFYHTTAGGTHVTGTAKSSIGISGDQGISLRFDIQSGIQHAANGAGVAGGSYTVNTGDAADAIGTGGAGAGGGQYAVNTGDGSAAIDEDGGAGGNYIITTGSGGVGEENAGADKGVGGSGGDYLATLGIGGNATSGNKAGGIGGGYNFTTGDGGAGFAATTSAVGGDAGDFVVTPGTGGAGAGGGAAGRNGYFYVAGTHLMPFPTTHVADSTLLNSTGQLRYDEIPEVLEYKVKDSAGAVAVFPIYQPAYICVTTDEASSESEFEYDIFADASYPGTLDYTEHTSQDITFTQADGRFTVDNAGIYEIALSLYCKVSGSTDVVINVYVDGGTPVWTTTTFIHSAVDAVERSVVLQRALAANNYIEVTIDSASVYKATIQSGTTLSIKRIDAPDPS